MVYTQTQLVDNDKVLNYRIDRLNLIILEMTGFLLYSSMLAYAWLRLSKNQTLSRHTPRILFAIILLHGLVAYLNIDTENGHNFGLFNIFSMTTWFTMIIVYWNLLKHQAYALLIVSLPIAAASLLEVAIFDGVSPVHLEGKLIDILHILMGISAMSILMLAALQASLVLYIDNGLRNHPASIHPWLGPLQSMERYLIQLLSSGFILMTCAFLLVIFLPNDAENHQGLHKIILTVLSWIVLGGLLFGHYKKGWRGVFAAKWSLVSVFLLLLGYFGSKLVIEFIL